MARLRSTTLLPAVLFVGFVGYAASQWLGDEDVDDMVDVEASGPTSTTLGELVAASDLVVEATVVSVEDGRVITDPDNPDSGIRTQLARLDVVDVFAGSVDDSLVVEQEAALLDGTPISVNGRRALRPGDTGFFFLGRGGSEDFPYTALVGDQGWLPVIGDTIEARTPLDPIGEAWDGRDRAELRAELRAVSTAGS